MLEKGVGSPGWGQRGTRGPWGEPLGASDVILPEVWSEERPSQLKPVNSHTPLSPLLPVRPNATLNLAPTPNLAPLSSEAAQWDEDETPEGKAEPTWLQ